MKKKFIFVLLVLLFTLFFGNSVLADVKVEGYYRSDGTYVQPHYRSDSDGNFDNNWSTKGNVNPYTGKPGTKEKYITGSSYNNQSYQVPNKSASPNIYNLLWYGFLIFMTFKIFRSGK